MDMNMELIKILLMKIRDDPTMDGVTLHEMDWKKRNGIRVIQHIAGYEISEDFSVDQIRYSIILMYEAGLLSGHAYHTVEGNTKKKGVPWICGLTIEGHNFLRNIETDTTWQKVKKIASSASLSTLIQVSSQLAVKIASQELIPS